ncbi:LptF/LptG family permease [Candidatus Pelagibacter bacterium nBUS_32]|jgi:lipopolysaccharide export system permease protein|uniref:LptF/LptG family permease n=1 Tax=Candidatus Pelagibacter bacterium nBUS_32 TaxID=3374192 RepID=UPI003EBCEB83
MKTYIKFITNIYLRSFLFVLLITFSLVFIINLLTELEFFKNINVSIFFTIYLSLLNSPSMIFEIFPFIFLITTQLFYIKLFNNNEIQIFKYSGLKNSVILTIIGLTTLLIGIFIISVFYNTTSNLKSFYLELKNNYTKDGKYLAVINKNGLWIRDKIENKIFIINSSKVNKNFLIDSFITEFDTSYNVVRNIKSRKINIKNNEWIILKPEVFENNVVKKFDKIKINSNFNYKRINSLFSNLSSLSFIELIELKRNYDLLNYSTIDVIIQIQKIISYPFYLVLMTIFSSLIMLSSKKINSNTVKISIGLFLCVVIYYLNNLLNVLGATEKINYILSVWLPLLFLSFLILFMMQKINEK